jgi:hypothetical protein
MGICVAAKEPAAQDKKGIEHLPYYEPKAGARKPERVALVIPHSNEIPTAHPFRKALAKRLMSEGIEVTTRTETGMMKRGWEMRRRLDAEFESRLRRRLDTLASASGGARINPETLRWEERLELAGWYLSRILTPGDSVLTAMLSLDDHARRVKAIAECLAAGNDLVVELHAMDHTGYFGAAAEAGFARIGSRMLFVPDAITMINKSFLGKQSTLAKIEETVHNASELAAITGIDMEAIFIEYSQAGDRARQLGGRAALIEIPSLRVEMAPGHPMYGYYRDYIRSQFEYTYCEPVRKPVNLPEEEIEAAAWALGAIERRVK